MEHGAPPEADRTDRPKTVIIGGGLTGLATAWWLRDHTDVELFESSDRLGGCIRTVDFDGTPFDVGADAMLAARPEAVALTRAAGFGDDDLVAPATSTVLLWRNGRFRRLPPATVMGVPTAPHRLVTSGIVGPGQLVRAGIEPWKSWRARAQRSDKPVDLSVRELVASRFGPAIADRLVDPLLAGVYAGDIGRLSVEATVPPLWNAYRSGGSMLRALRRQRARRVGHSPMFLTLRGGLARLVDQLAADLAPRVALGTRVDRIIPGVQRRWRVLLDRGEPTEADHVVVAIPAAQAAGLLAEAAPEVQGRLREARAASVVVVALAYPGSCRSQIPQASGFLVARSDLDGLVKAVTFSARKWPHLAQHPNVLLRASVGHIDDERAATLTDDELAASVAAELAAKLGLAQPPVGWTVARWPQALPQYDVGHVHWGEQLRAKLRAHAPGIHLAGAGFDGVGLAARAAEARALAGTILGTPVGTPG